MTNILTIDSLFGFIPLDKLIAVVSIALFTIVNIRGTSETGKIGTVVTVVQLVAIISVIIAGLWTMANNSSSHNWQSNFADFMPMGLGGLVSAMGLTFIAFEGYEDNSSIRRRG